jgi:uncharacterized protein (DUF305 family)
MHKPTLFLASSALALMLASCGSGSDPSPSASASEPAMADTGPFSAVEMAMSDKMDSAIGSSVSDTWLAQMIEHHRGAIAMSKIVLEQNPSSIVRKMAEDTITNQSKEIDDLTKLRSNGAVDPASVTPYRPATMEMHQAMMAAQGADISETYLRKMLAHHRGAVALSDVVIAQGTDAKVRAAAQKAKAVQAKEAAMIEDMLAGKPMTMAAPAAPQPTPTDRVSVTAPKPAPSPAKSRATVPKPTPFATAPDHKMDDMSNMKM